MPVPGITATGSGRERAAARHRLCPVEVPPLRDRIEDVVPLALSFLDDACKELGRKPFQLSRHQVAALENYDWPGNIRELKNIVERAVISSTGDKLMLDVPANDGPARGDVAELQPTHETNPESGGFLTNEEFRQLEKANIIAALKEANWKTWGDDGAAALLGVKPTTLAYQIKTLEIKKPSK